ncbi:sensor histidine kinase [Polyangium mundeleinium]|uniref:histidine kinase n=1 Tax=Polyangium mundeleinium TaxID=2995306 RepID=A0ABT5EPA4_9BACT|nr:HAMP domain-containing sensor histidine kinase [Polyangium mundeleinium]MDC0743289.1 HAMP domain-containing sensor histidine kinase [Polyangium mundeleinium]
MDLRRELRLLLVAVLLMVVGTVASLAILTKVGSSLAETKAAIAENAAPTVVALDQAQARLRRLHVLLLERHMGSPGDPLVRSAAIATADRELKGAIRDYLALPADPGEEPFQRAITQSLTHADRVVDRVLALEPGELGRSDLRVELDAAMAQLSLDLVEASEFSMHIANASTKTVVWISRTLVPIEATVEVFTFLATVATLALTYRMVQRARTLAAEHLTSLASRADELENFAGRVAHDLMSPLAGVALALDLASRRLTAPEDTPTQKAIVRASRTLQRVRRFVSDLLEFARAGARPLPGARARVDDAIREVADEFGPLAEDAGVELRAEPLGATCALACSPGVLSSVLSNLVQNAIKYIGDGAERCVSIRCVDLVEEVRIEVEDTGPGIAPEDRASLFDLYARGRDAKAPGLGLGLATVKRLVESHGGDIGVKAGPRRGSVFWFSMPVAAHA